MTATLDAILADLREGLAERAARRRRRRAAGATVATSLALAAIGVGALGVVAETAPTTASEGTIAARFIADGDCAALDCWPADRGAALLGSPTVPVHDSF